MMKKEIKNISRDLAVVVISIIVAIILAKTGALESILTSTQEWKALGSIIAGMFFVSAFTAAPAGVVLFEIAATNSLWEVAFFGGIGALIGDLLIFRFIKDGLSEDLLWMMGKFKNKKISILPRFKVFRYLMPIVGAIIVASPVPDEIGLAMMGLSKMKTAVFIPISFALNFLGIFVIGLFANGNF